VSRAVQTVCWTALMTTTMTLYWTLNCPRLATDWPLMRTQMTPSVSSLVSSKVTDVTQLTTDNMCILYEDFIQIVQNCHMENQNSSCRLF